MIATLLALALSAPDTMASVFAAAGLDFVENSSTTGVLRTDGTEIRVWGILDSKGLWGVSIARMVRAKRYIPQAELDGWAKGSATKWETFLDHRVMAEGEISFKQGPNRAASLKAGVKKFSDDWKAFGTKFPGGTNLNYRQWHANTNAPPLNDRIVVSRMGERDFEYLAHQCGWAAKNSFAGSTPGWVVSLNLNSETAYVMPAFQEGKFGPGFEIMTGEIEISAPFVSAFIGTVNKKMRQAKVEAGATDKTIKVRARYSLAKPVEVRAVVAFIQEFGIDLATIRREIE